MAAITGTPVLCYFLLPASRIREGGDGAVLRFLKRINRVVVGWAIARTRPVALAALAFVIVVGGSLTWIPRVFITTMNDGWVGVFAQLSPRGTMGASNRMGRMGGRREVPDPAAGTIHRQDSLWAGP